MPGKIIAKRWMKKHLEDKTERFRRRIEYAKTKAAADVEFWNRVYAHDPEKAKDRIEGVYQKLGEQVRQAEAEINRMNRRK